ncbi:MAG: system FeS assembly protein NifU family [Gemmatimonadetes bacterium]|nr:system FeS assembly protein NifU family [Gemmatimonadota bacterium]
MSLDALYQEIILEHNRRPRNSREMTDATARVDQHNPLCGDELTLWVRLGDDGTLDDASFKASGCAISRASASLMTSAVKGKSRAEALELGEKFRELVTGKLDPVAAKGELGSLVALGGVSRFPQRVKCASMAWHALREALGDAG